VRTGAGCVACCATELMGKIHKMMTASVTKEADAIPPVPGSGAEAGERLGLKQFILSLASRYASALPRAQLRK
jgi:hypothetical protein